LFNKKPSQNEGGSQRKKVCSRQLDNRLTSLLLLLFYLFSSFLLPFSFLSFLFFFLFSQNRHEPNLNQGLDNKGFSAKSEGDISHLGSQNSLQHKTSSQAELDTNESEDPSNTTPEEARESFSSQTSLEHKTLSQVELETNDFGDPSNSTPEEIRESLTSNSNEEFSFSSQSFEHDTRPSTADTELTASGGQILTTTAGPNISQDAQPSTSTENSNVPSRGKQFWNKARKLASERRRSRLEQNRVVSTEGGKTGNLFMFHL